MELYTIDMELARLSTITSDIQINARHSAHNHKIVLRQYLQATSRVTKINRQPQHKVKQRTCQVTNPISQLWGQTNNEQVLSLWTAALGLGSRLGRRVPRTLKAGLLNHQISTLQVALHTRLALRLHLIQLLFKQ